MKDSTAFILLIIAILAFGAFGMYLDKVYPDKKIENSVKK